MSQSDGSDSKHLAEPAAAAGDSVDHMLVESLMHLLMEKGVLTKNDALNVVQTVAEVVGGNLGNEAAPEAPARTALRALRRIYASFEAATERPGVLQVEGGNVHRLRPPLQDQPQFPGAD